MSMSVDAVSLYIPTANPPKVDPAAAPTSDQASALTATTAKWQKESDKDGITPVPIQPLSNRMLATFMEKDIELYGSMFG
jgi:hypothetical protein